MDEPIDFFSTLCAAIFTIVLSIYYIHGISTIKHELNELNKKIAVVNWNNDKQDCSDMVINKDTLIKICKTNKQ